MSAVAFQVQKGTAEAAVQQVNSPAAAESGSGYTGGHNKIKAVYAAHDVSRFGPDVQPNCSSTARTVPEQSNNFAQVHKVLTNVAPQA